MFLPFKLFFSWVLIELWRNPRAALRQAARTQFSLKVRGRLTLSLVNASTCSFRRNLIRCKNQEVKEDSPHCVKNLQRLGCSGLSNFLAVAASCRFSTLYLILNHGCLQTSPDSSRRECLEPGEPFLRLVWCWFEWNRSPRGHEGRNSSERWGETRVIL